MNGLQTADAAAPPATQFSLTDNAARRLAELMREDGAASKLRIAVTGGGCSGFQYNFTFDDVQGDDDLVFERNGVVVLIDSMSMEYLQGSELDFVEDMVGASFQVRNPNATAKCGCGSSFAV